MINKSFRIAELIAGYISQSLTKEEQQELDTWRSYPENEVLFQKICNEGQMQEHYHDRKRFNPEEAWEQIERQIEKKVRRSYFLTFSRYAALFILPVCLFFTLVNTNDRESEISGIAEVTRIEPGDKKAILTLDNGEVIELADLQGILTEKDGTVINVDSSTLNYNKQGLIARSDEVIYNKIEVPHGGEYSLYLSDGTKVYLNAMSSLRFPVNFTGNSRTVELEGEAYFEVSPGKIPFIVKTKHLETRVLGTSFNISAYEGENVEATLVSGSVMVSTLQGTSQTLKPSQQAVFIPGSENILIEEVDAVFYTSWIKGKINFKDRSLEEIMKTLARWYDIEVEFANETLRKMKFGCYVDRYQEIKPFIELVEISGKLKITQKDKTIIIDRK